MQAGIVRTAVYVCRELFEPIAPSFQIRDAARVSLECAVELRRTPPTFSLRLQADEARLPSRRHRSLCRKAGAVAPFWGRSIRCPLRCLSLNRNRLHSLAQAIHQNSPHDVGGGSPLERCRECPWRPAVPSVGRSYVFEALHLQSSPFYPSDPSAAPAPRRYLRTSLSARKYLSVARPLPGPDGMRNRKREQRAKRAAGGPTAKRSGGRSPLAKRGQVFHEQPVPLKQLKSACARLVSCRSLRMFSALRVMRPSLNGARLRPRGPWNVVYTKCSGKSFQPPMASSC